MTKGEEYVKIPKKDWDSLLDRLQRLESRVKEVEGSLAKTNSDNVEIVKSLEFTQENVDDITGRLDSQQREQEDLAKDVTELEMYGRRWNLIFHGIQETERENCTRKVRDFISEEMNINTQEMKMCAVHRLGKPRNGKTRPVIARFTCRADRDRVWKNKAHIKNKRIYITDDVPEKVRELRRNILVPALRRVKEGGKRGMIVGNKLIIESKQYEHWEIPRRWLQDETTDGTASDPVREGGGQEEEPTEGRRRPTETVRTQPGQELTNSPRQTRSTLLQIPTYLQAAKRNLRPRRSKKR
ncbi:hypothetical protein Bbelb_334700 [Branchiostoma belcheri]|nr:hypothetical protein Bbelb_351030 [Branchiostoma belcheri]KAI8488952.1 hypothetical protein Bbelb_334700 [Branchiostoma belcheri]